MKRSLFLCLLFILSLVLSLQAQECDPDVKAPAPFCIAGLVININNTGPGGTFEQPVWANDFIKSELTVDNCSTVLNYRMEVFDQTPAGAVPEAEGVTLTEVNASISSVRIWVGDEAGNWDYCETFVQLNVSTNCENDNFPPFAQCQSSKDVSLDAISGKVTVLPEVLNDGSIDNCSTNLTFGISLGTTGDIPLPSLNFSEIGTYLVTLTVADEGNNRSHCQTYVNVFDQNGNGPDCSNDLAPPIAICSEGQVFVITTISNPLVLTADFMGLQSYDNCSDLSFRIENGAPGASLPATSSLTFDETGFGIKPVTIWAIDEAGNTNHCTVDINVTTNFTKHTFDGSVFIDDGDCLMNFQQETIDGISVKVQLKVNGVTKLSRIIETGGNLLSRYWTGFSEFTPTRIGYGLAPGQSVEYAPGDQIDVEVTMWENINTICQNTYILEDITAGDNSSTHTNNFGIAVESPCPALYVDLATSFLRRCFEGTYWVNYCNYGGAKAKDATITVTFDDYLEVVSTGITPSSVDGQTYVFSVGDIASGDCGRFPVQVLVKCEAELGQTHCSNAVITHTNTCGSSYQGPELELKAECEGETVKFKVRNIGSPMEEGHHYIVIEDILMMESGTTLALLSGEEQAFSFPANGKTFRLEVDQAGDYPWAKIAGLSLEGCGRDNNGNFSTGLVTQFSEADWRPDVSVDCQVNRSSYDPNDKQAFPTGVGADKLTPPNTELEYMIRFQNTGTDTAFTVVISDQLSELLDISTVKPGASSHPYSFALGEDRLMKFTFSDILLPDSTTNEIASHGFVKFSVSQVADNPIGSLITNSAAIFFDFNEPVITNTVTHLIGINTLSGNRQLAENWLKTQVVPNPFSESTVLQIENAPAAHLDVQIFDHMGKLVRTEAMKTGQLVLHRNGLPSGMYYYTVSGKSGVVSVGKLILN
ncbi:MAG: T9SS type A sorting domain-containing protein [Saprospiraceae bacterium]